ncbi:putative Stress responsive A/B Barrel Domain superfamily [Vibrio nigripulchritudo SO65]|uniref:Dabb family protein n=1 Tax=Vibrio nigripulchritudo TaxID=28173 RepID=UPI0003B243DD|nr:Dabb family protein [Vibrio nigripulchritudo]CCN37570.1 putative Stress responsive A/B Barrel Domain superfamily [Vibrio nigripulchritudo AM115]CCN39568.1 putative Stress responsive A/B Barrel Domain superfamily [Vibrio nigripulchritudo FTn2]CCN66806.1 putative Stress responsive A/B Barrel Domain superfamily [Vibrio nigripulchritudo POn4]CCN75668.1 putative Stress responsive A/B Barrel Domain superfamily [Vibrio nigripulchritudo SO65]
MIRHLLLVQFKASAQESDVQALLGLFVEIPQKVDGVSAVEWGENDSPEGKNKQYTHCIFMTFADEAGRQNYLEHPEHEDLKAKFHPILEDIVVLDYQPQS